MPKTKFNQPTSNKYYTRIIRSYQKNSENFSDKHKDLLHTDAVQMVSD